LEKYSTKKFHLALKDILEKKDVKLRGLAGRTNLNYTYFSKLKAREKSPPVRTIEIIAAGLKISPQYFLEYRIHQITDFLTKNPEMVGSVMSFIEDLTREEVPKVAEPGEEFDN